MKYLLALFLGAFIPLVCYSQNSSESVTVDEVFIELKKINTSEEGKLVYRKYKNFNFKEFSPVEGQVDSLDYFEVGYSKNGDIKEVIRHAKKHEILNYMFKVYDAGRFRILILKKSHDKKYYFTSLAFLLIRQLNNDNNIYMIDVVARFGKEKPVMGFWHPQFPITTPENISAIARLNENLYPEHELQILNNRVLMSSYFIYKRDNQKEIDTEVVLFFFTRENYPALQLTSKESLRDILEKEQIGEYQLGIRPDMHGFDEEPLWILEGHHNYRK